MSTFSDLLVKAKELETELTKDGTVLVGEAETKLKDLLQNLEHEVEKEVSPLEHPAQTPTAPQSDSSGVQTSSDLQA
jgi:hypothetical protein